MAMLLSGDDPGSYDTSYEDLLRLMEQLQAQPTLLGGDDPTPYQPAPVQYQPVNEMLMTGDDPSGYPAPVPVYTPPELPDGSLARWLESGFSGGGDLSALSGLGIDLTGQNAAQWNYTPNTGDSGGAFGYTLTPEAQSLLNGYTVSNPQMTDTQNIVSVADPTGASLGEVSTPVEKDNWFDSFMYSGAPIALLALGGLTGMLPGTEGLLGGAAEGAAAGAEAASAVTPEMLAAANAAADPIAALNAAAGWTGVDAAYLAGAGGLASSAVTPEMLTAANASADPIAALNAATGWTGADAGYLASLPAASSTTPEMLAAANATSDPIAALNASAGWTGVDPAYLASIEPVTSAVTQPMISAANETLDPIAALNNSAGWTGVDKAYLASIGLPELGGAMAGLGGPAIGPEAIPGLLGPTAALPPLPPMTPSVPSVPGVPASSPIQPIKDAASSAFDFLKDNKWALPLLGAGLSGLSGQQKTGGYVDSGYRPTITRNPSGAPKPSYMPLNPVGLLGGGQYGMLNTPQQGNANSGLWRYLLKGN
jgi:hypothetical protein